MAISGNADAAQNLFPTRYTYPWVELHVSYWNGVKWPCTSQRMVQNGGLVVAGGIVRK